MVSPVGGWLAGWMADCHFATCCALIIGSLFDATMRNVVLNDDYAMIMAKPKSNGANKMYLQISGVVGGGGGVAYSLNLLCIIIIIYWNGYKFAPTIVHAWYTRIRCSVHRHRVLLHPISGSRLNCVSSHQPTIGGTNNKNTHNRIQTCTRSRSTRNVCEVFSLFLFHYVFNRRTVHLPY